MDEIDPDQSIDERDLIHMKESPVRARWRIFFVVTICLLGLAVMVASITCHVHCTQPEKKIIVTDKSGQQILIPPPTPKPPNNDCTPGSSGKKRKTCNTGTGQPRRGHGRRN